MIAAGAAWELRAAATADLAAAARLGQDVPGAWGEQALATEFGGHGARLQVAHAPRAPAIPLGVAAGRIVGPQAELAWLAVAPAWRRRGVARALLLDLIAAARRQGAEALWLEVRAGQAAARALYAAVGLRQVGQRAGYYDAPLDDAILMALPLT